MAMKSFNAWAGAAILGMTLSGCGLLEIDNYDAPTSLLSGTLLFEGQPVGVRTGGVELELWEPGWELNQKINVYVSQDGNFSAMLFDGDYKLNAIANSGPWVNTTDTINIQVRGNTQVNLPVRPFFVVRNPVVTYDPNTGAGGTINATFQIAEIEPGRVLEWAGLYVATTSFVDRTNRLVQLERTRAQLPATWPTAPVTLSLALPANVRDTPSPTPRERVYVRVGVKTTGFAEMIFSPLIEVGI
jgi:hypothetical protein